MTPSRPYLIRAMYEWIQDNALTPYMLVDAYSKGVDVPLEYANDGKIVLCISNTAVTNLELGNEDINFTARFGGIPRAIFVPIYAVEALYAKENGRGMFFQEEEGLEPPDAPPPNGPDSGGDGPKPPKGSGSRPQLRVVK